MIPVFATFCTSASPKQKSFDELNLIQASNPGKTSNQCLMSLSTAIKGLFILGPNHWAQFKATNIDQWECPVGHTGPSLGPKGFILRPVPIFPCFTWHPM